MSFGAVVSLCFTMHGKISSGRCYTIAVASLFVGSVASQGADVFTSGVIVGSGTGNTVDGSSLVVGSGSTAKFGSLAVGANVDLQGSSNSLGVGLSLQMDAGWSAMFGIDSSLSVAEGMLVSGANNTVTEQYYGLVVGYGNTVWAPTEAGGAVNVVLGGFNHINANHSAATPLAQGVVLMGLYNQTQESQAWVLGMGNIGQESTVTLGTYNETVANASLIVGTGTEESDRSNGLVVLKNGTVKIPGGNLQLGNESALTTTLLSDYLVTNHYLKNETASGYGVLNGGIAAVGMNAKASGSNTLAMGTSATAETSTLAQYSTALGAYTTAGENAVAIGGDAVATGLGSVAIGQSVGATGSASVALGAFAGAEGNDAVAVGNQAVAMGESSTALGRRTEANGAYSSAFGYGALTQGVGEIAFGFNVPQPAPVGTWKQTENLFVVGNGSGAVNETTQEIDRSNAMVILKNGRATVTNRFWNSSVPTSIPANPDDASDGEALEVKGHSVLKGNAVVEGNTVHKGDTVLEGKVTLAQPQGDISMGIYQ